MAKRHLSTRPSAPKSLNVAKELAQLEAKCPAELAEVFEELFGEACRSKNKQWLMKRIIWRMQANAEGDLSERARRRAEELANDADLRLKPPRDPKPEPARMAKPVSRNEDHRVPMPGAVLTREYKGETIAVTVRKDGFEYQGEVYKSLSAVAKEVTGTHWNGYHFFGLKNGGAKS